MRMNLNLGDGTIKLKSKEITKNEIKRKKTYNFLIPDSDDFFQGASSGS